MSSYDNASSVLAGARRGAPSWWMIGAVLLSITAASFLAGFLLGHLGLPGHDPNTANTPAEFRGQFYVFWEAWQQIEQKFYTEVPIDTQAMTYGAIDGMLSSLNDSFTSFTRPSEGRLENEALQGDFGGISASLARVDAWPTFVEVHVGSAAEAAGLRPGDRLLTVDGTEVERMPLDQVALLIRGPLDTSVSLDVQRGRIGKLSLSIVRQPVELPSLSSRLLCDGIGYVSIHLFSAHTGDELAAAIQDLEGQHSSALALDLRGNGGGLTAGAIDVLRRLIGHGIAFRELRNGSAEQRHAIPFGEPALDWPLVVLLDGGTASAAEIVAAAIRDYERGILIGQRTLGKGSVQSAYKLSDGSTIHLTTSHWLSAGGYSIDGVGLIPDIVVDSADTSRGDPFLRSAVDYLQQQTERVSTDCMSPIDSNDSGKVLV